MAWKWLDNLRGIEGRVTELSGTVYLLRKDRIESTDHRYIVTRTEAARAIKGLTPGRYAYRDLSFKGSGLDLSTYLTIPPDGGVKAGCQYFDSPEAAKLRDWALKG